MDAGTGGPPACGDGVTDPGEACDDGNTADGDWCAAACDQAWGVDVHDPATAGRIDILFVVDNSASMCEEQINLRASFQSFIDALVAAGGIDFQIGVVTTDTMDPMQSGRLQNVPRALMNTDDCTVALPPPDDCTTGLPSPLPKILTPATVDLAHVFGCIASVGIDGFGGEAPLAAVELALSPPLAAPGGANEGFLRDDAALAVVFVGDEDDCSVCDDPAWPGQCQFMPSITQNLDCALWQVDSLTPVSTFVDVMRARRPPGRVITAGVIGLDPSGASAGPVFADPDEVNYPDQLYPICTSSSGRAAPAPRIESYVRAFAPLAAETSICTDDFAAPLADLGTRFGVAVDENNCLLSTPCPGLTAADVQVAYLDAAGAAVTVDPADYTLVADATCPGGQALDFTAPPPAGSVLVVTYPAQSPTGLGC
jgi:cysteine-rich repeat protein